jgi:3-phosphoshikimate 1-carboxyvinyltransferase
MQKITVNQSQPLKGEVELPADKSISHRSVIIGSISRGLTEIDNFLKSEDCLHTIEVFKQLGVNISWPDKDRLLVEGRGLRGLVKPSAPLYFGNSGTGARLAAGILTGQEFASEITGDESLSRRPMRRIVEPLRQMGAEITADYDERHLPLKIKGGKLKPINYKSPVASAQVKSSILLAALYAGGTSCVTEPYKSRDHTERMLSYFGAKMNIENLKVCLSVEAEFTGKKIRIPNDISNAAFFIVAASIIENSKLHLREVGINPTRSAILDVLRKMGADFQITNNRLNSNEPRADISVKSRRLKAVRVEEDMVPLLIDELPILMVAATQAQGQTVIKNASELRVKETDRINSMVTNLKKLGADIRNIEDDVIIKGPSKLKGTEVLSFGDHRTAMSMSIAGLVAEGETKVLNTECIKTSFPDFEKALKRIIP